MFLLMKLKPDDRDTGCDGASVMAAASLAAASAALLHGTSTWPGIHCSTTLPGNSLSIRLIGSESSDAFDIDFRRDWLSEQITVVP